MKYFLMLLVISCKNLAIADSDIINSVGKINVISYPNGSSFEMDGSGTIIYVKNQNFFMTNAHVCVGAYIGLLSNKKTLQLKTTLSKSIVQYSIKTKNKSYEMLVKLSENIIDFKKDLCLIPLKDSTFKGFVIREKLIPDRQNTSIVYKFEKNKIITVKGYFDKKIKKESSTTYFDLIENKNKEIVNYGQISMLTIKSNPGDSGSLVVNSKNELFGMVYGASRNQSALVISDKDIILFLQTVL